MQNATGTSTALCRGHQRLWQWCTILLVWLSEPTATIFVKYHSSPLKTCIPVPPSTTKRRLLSLSAMPSAQLPGNTIFCNPKRKSVGSGACASISGNSTMWMALRPVFIDPQLARNRGVEMNHVDHPTCGGNHQHIGKASTIKEV
ncbi:hypothetical protein DL96DRAFT_1691054 [Flagelloscypha sp. PMI_526]|nr:hypothetical protein DL96DRAFT_1691054 [Flagelloscypha sp. PMI_526]